MYEINLCGQALDEPVLLVGRGGSGTRMLSDLAVELGIFLGSEISVTGNSTEWVSTLYELALENLADEIQTGSGKDIRWRDRLRTTAAGILSREAGASAVRWGWKLPETILALGPVLRAFPKAQVIHLVRHPVTSCLRRTHITSRMDNAVGTAVIAAAYQARGMTGKDARDDEAYVHNAVTWNFQVSNALDTLRTAEASALILRYEDLCSDPQGVQTDVARFLDIAVPEGARGPVVDWERTNAAAALDDRAARVWAICGETAEALGYIKP